MFSIDNRHLSTAGSSLAPVYISNFPIHYAIRSCDCSSAVELIETSHKADALTLSAFDFYGDSPLQLAVQNKLGSIIDVLVLFGAKTEAINSRGDSLREALEKCQFRFALFAKVEVDSKSKRSRPTLNLARSVNLLQAIENEPFAKGEKRPVLKRTRPSTSLSLTPTPRPSLKTDELPTSRRSRGFSTDSFSRFTRPLSASIASTSPEQCPYSFEMVPYLNAVKKMLDEQKVDLLAHTYFIFFDEDILFDYLLQMGEKHKKPISGFLVTLMLQGFPNGIDKLTASADKLTQLTQCCRIDIPFLNQIVAGNVISKNSLRASQTQKEMSMTAGDLHLMTPQQLAEMLTFRDVATISEIEFSELRDWLEDEKNISVPIKAAGENFSKTVAWITRIIKSCDGETQDQTIEFFVEMGSILLKNANFHGAMQISAAFDLSGCSQKVSECGRDAIALLNLSHFHKNYHYYQAAIKSLPEGTLYLPYLSLVWRDMKMLHQELTDSSTSQMKLSMLDDLSTSVKQLLNFRRTLFSSSNWNESCSRPNFLFNLPDLGQ